MEAENALTIAKENSKENFFEEEARLWAEVYGKQSDKPDLESLQRMLENMNHLLLSLELPIFAAITIKTQKEYDYK